MNWGNDMAQIACVLLAMMLLVGACEKRTLVRNNCPDSSVCVEVNLPSRDASQPTYRESTEHFVKIAAGFEEACGIRMDGSIRCWGYAGTWMVSVLYNAALLPNRQPEHGNTFPLGKTTLVR